MSYEILVDYKNNSFKCDRFLKNKLNFGQKNKKSFDNRVINKNKIESLSKIDIKNYILNTFAIKTNFKLTSPYYSSDNDDFYIISNPCIKEYVFKVPMVRGSSWKGALLKAGIEIFKEEKNHEYLGNIFRIFGVGNSEYRELFDKNDKVIENKILIFLALEMGISFEKEAKEQLKDYFKIKAQKGRAIFYPTYFNRLSLEVINPHNRKTKAGTNPIHYEVVPKDTFGELQIVYIPFDGVLEDNKSIKQQAEQDLKFLQRCINKVAQNGIGAKTKLGWGRFEIKEVESEWSKR